MAMAAHSQLDAAVLKWFLQQRANGVNASGVEIMTTAVKLAQELGIVNFKGSDGWLWRFRNRHGLFDVNTHGESGSADSTTFRACFNKFLEEKVSIVL